MKHFLVIASKADLAGMNITKHLFTYAQENIGKEKRTINFYYVEQDILHEEHLDKSKLKNYDCIIFASKHSSASGKKTLSLHAVGNWTQDHPYGGKPKKISPAPAQLMKHTFQLLNQNAQKHTPHYDVTLEATHHGPLIDKPCFFIEIGSATHEWKDPKAGFVIAKTIFDAIETYEEQEHSEIAFGIGGPHYCPNFNPIQLESNVAIGHIIPGYVLPLTDDMVEEALAKIYEGDIEFALLDWKGMGNKEQRDQLLKVLSKNYVRHETTTAIKKR